MWFAAPSPRVRWLVGAATGLSVAYACYTRLIAESEQELVERDQPVESTTAVDQPASIRCDDAPAAAAQQWTATELCAISLRDHDGLTAEHIEQVVALLHCPIAAASRADLLRCVVSSKWFLTYIDNSADGQSVVLSASPRVERSGDAVQVQNNNCNSNTEALAAEQIISGRTLFTAERLKGVELIVLEPQSSNAHAGVVLTKEADFEKLIQISTNLQIESVLAALSSYGTKSLLVGLAEPQQRLLRQTDFFCFDMSGGGDPSPFCHTHMGSLYMLLYTTSDHARRAIKALHRVGAFEGLSTQPAIVRAGTYQDVVLCLQRPAAQCAGIHINAFVPGCAYFALGQCIC